MNDKGKPDRCEHIKVELSAWQRSLKQSWKTSNRKRSVTYTRGNTNWKMNKGYDYRICIRILMRKNEEPSTLLMLSDMHIKVIHLPSNWQHQIIDIRINTFTHHLYIPLGRHCDSLLNFDPTISLLEMQEISEYTNMKNVHCITDCYSRNTGN